MATKKSTKKKSKYSRTNPSPAQLRARRKFAQAAKARAKAARAAKRAAAATTKPKKRTTAKRTVAKKRNATSVKGKTRYIVVKGNRKVFKTSYRLKSEATKAARRVGGTVKAVIAGTTRRRNADHRDAAHPIEVRKYWRSGGPGYKTQWQRAHEAGQKQLFPVKNGKKKNGSTSQARKKFTEFTGIPSRKLTDTYAPKGSGARGTLAYMGKLKSIKVRGRHTLDFKGGPNAPTLARDPKTDQMFVLGKGYRLKLPRRNPGGMEDLGEITKIEYEVEKPHLGHPETVTWYHHMGEEGGEKPHLLVNQEGLVLIDGGDYTIGAEGIRN